MENKKSSQFGILKKEKIIAILIGESKFGTINDVDIAMPFLSGEDIVSILKFFNCEIKYEPNFFSAGQLENMYGLIDYGIENDKMSKILNYLFSEKQFKKRFYSLEPDQFAVLYIDVKKQIINEINDLLFYYDCELIEQNGEFNIVSIARNIQLATPQIKNVDNEYIKSIFVRAIEDVKNKNYDSAITKSRTLLEEVFLCVIEKKNEKPKSKGDIGKLYKQVKDLYNMHSDKATDIRINKLISGLEVIVSSIAEIRNINSDAHGVGSSRISIAEHHARLVVNAAMTLAEFVLSVGNNCSELNK